MMQLFFALLTLCLGLCLVDVKASESHTLHGYLTITKCEARMGSVFCDHSGTQVSKPLHFDENHPDAVLTASKDGIPFKAVISLRKVEPQFRHHLLEVKCSVGNDLLVEQMPGLEMLISNPAALPPFSTPCRDQHVGYTLYRAYVRLSAKVSLPQD